MLFHGAPVGAGTVAKPAAGRLSGGEFARVDGRVQEVVFGVEQKMSERIGGRSVSPRLVERAEDGGGLIGGQIFERRLVAASGFGLQAVESVAVERLAI